MKKNTASQVIGVQMVSATDGSAFTGATTVYVTGGAGTQAIGSVGSGACTHEGNGFHTYAPAQAETNYDHIAFTFTGTGAVPASIQLYTEFPQSGDAFTRLGAPAGASVSADILVIDGYIDTEVAAILAAVDTEVAAIKAKTDNLPAAPAAVGDIPTAAEINAEVVDALNVDTYAEPGQGAPAATASLAAKINYLYKAWRNKKTQTATAFSLFADDALTVDQKATVSDDATTATIGEMTTGP